MGITLAAASSGISRPLWALPGCTCRPLTAGCPLAFRQHLRSLHGRGFFQPLQSLGDPIAALAAIEAVIGLLIEISFIATFTQRFFGAK